MSYELDIRQKEAPKPKVIRFASPGVRRLRAETLNLEPDDGFLTIGNGELCMEIFTVEDARNLVKALQKAIELKEGPQPVKRGIPSDGDL